MCKERLYSLHTITKEAELNTKTSFIGSMGKDKQSNIKEREDMTKD